MMIYVQDMSIVNMVFSQHREKLMSVIIMHNIDIQVLNIVKCRLPKTLQMFCPQAVL